MMRWTFTDDEANTGTFKDAQVWAPTVESIMYFV